MVQGMTHALPLVINPSRPLPSTIVDSKAKATWDIWHRRLAHLNEGSMRLLLGGRSTGGSLKRSTKTPHSATKCEGCVHGKIVRPPFSTSGSRAKSTLDLIHTDLCGPMGVDGQKKYMMVIVDDRTRYTWVYFLERKSDALECFKQWLVRVERLTEKTLKTVRSDNGGEYTGGKFEAFLKDKGIEHQTTIPTVLNRMELPNAPTVPLLRGQLLYSTQSPFQSVCGTTLLSQWSISRIARQLALSTIQSPHLRLCLTNVRTCRTSEL